MLIELHILQNHSPANLNRDDLNAPKTCYFGGVLRSRISSQCIKRSIRTSDVFKLLNGGVRTRRLPEVLAQSVGRDDVLPLARTIVQRCGLNKAENKDDEAAEKSNKKDVIAYLSKSAVNRMVEILKDESIPVAEKRVAALAREFAELVATDRHSPDMALCGRMLEPAKPAKAKGGKGAKAKDSGETDSEGDSSVWKGLKLSIEAALQVGHAFSTHAAHLEVDYFVAADDIPGEDSGGAHIGEAMFSSACFYKYFSIHWETLVSNLDGNAELAAHTVGAFIRSAALANPTGKQNCFAAHNPPDGMLIEFKNSPISYANAFASPVPSIGERDLISQSVAQLAQYAHDLDTGYGKPDPRFWFSPNLRYPLSITEDGSAALLTENNMKSLDALVPAVIKALGHDWEAVQGVVAVSEIL